MTVMENSTSEMQNTSKDDVENIKDTMSPTCETMVAIIKPDALSKKEAIVERIQQEGFNILQERTFQMTLNQATELYGSQTDYSAIDDFIKWVSSSDVCALMIEKENAINDFTDLLGSKNSSKAKKKKPKSLRALFGKDRFYNAVDGSESLQGAQKEIRVLFNQPRQSSSNASNEIKSEIMSDPLPSPAASPVIEGSQSTEIESYDKPVPAVKEDTAQEIFENQLDQQQVAHAYEDTTTAEKENEEVAQVSSSNAPEQPVSVREEEILKSVDQEARMDTQKAFVQQNDPVMVQQSSFAQADTDGVIQGAPVDIAVEQCVSTKESAPVDEEDPETEDIEVVQEILTGVSEQQTISDEVNKQIHVSNIKEEQESVENNSSEEQQNIPIETEEHTQAPADNIVVEDKHSIDDKKVDLESVSIQQEGLENVEEQVPASNVNDEISAAGTTPSTLTSASAEEPLNVSTKITKSLKPSPESSNKSVRSKTKVAKAPLERPTPSSSRLRQPMIKSSSKSPTNSGKPLLRRVERKPIPNVALKDVKDTSRIAKPMLAKDVEEKKGVEVTKRKPKSLPRVALIANQKPKQENNEQEKKPTEIKKKRQSSTKEFINRLTAPTLASINKKSETSNDATPAVRTKKQTTKTSKVSPHNSTLKKRPLLTQPKETQS